MMNDTFQSFQKNGHISFSCDRAGFVPDTLTKISCNENISSTSLNWDNQVPSCIGELIDIEYILVLAAINHSKHLKIQYIND